MADLIQKTDSLNDGRVKLNEAIKDADTAKVTAEGAEVTAGQATQIAQSAEDKADSVQEQFDQVVIDGDSSVEAAQARVDVGGEAHATLKARLDAEQTAVTSQLAETAADLIERSYNVKRYGAKGDNTTDDTDAIISVIAVMSEGDTLEFPRGRYVTTKPIAIDKNINVIMNGVLVAKHEGISMHFKDLGVATRIVPEFKIKTLKFNKDHSGNSVGVRITNAYNCKFRIDYVGDFANGLVLDAEGSRGTVYNEISLGQLYNNKRQIHITAQNPSWTNQNNFIGGRLYYATNVDRVGYVQIQIDGAANGAGFYGNNGNNFFGTSIEDVGVNGEFAKAVVINGHSNHFFSPRTEGSMIWEFGSSSYRNLIEGGTYIYMANFIDNGIDNVIVTQGTGSKTSIQTNGGKHQFKARVNNSTAIEAVAENAGALAVKAYNSASNGANAVSVMLSDGVTLAAGIAANGTWIVKDGTRKIMYGIYLGIPTTGTHRRGDMSYVTNPSKGEPWGYVCISGDGTGVGTWEVMGQAGHRTNTNPPTYIGQIAISGSVAYIATGTASVADWKQISN